MFLSLLVAIIECFFLLLLSSVLFTFCHRHISYLTAPGLVDINVIDMPIWDITVWVLALR